MGHIGGDDFIAVAEGDAASCMCETIIKAFNDSVPAFYSAEDVQRGYIEGKSRSNTEERFPHVPHHCWRSGQQLPEQF